MPFYPANLFCLSALSLFSDLDLWLYDFRRRRVWGVEWCIIRMIFEDFEWIAFSFNVFDMGESVHGLLYFFLLHDYFLFAFFPHRFFALFEFFLMLFGYFFFIFCVLFIRPVFFPDIFLGVFPFWGTLQIGWVLCTFGRSFFFFSPLINICFLIFQNLQLDLVGWKFAELNNSYFWTTLVGIYRKSVF